MEASAKMGSNLVFCQFARRPLDSAVSGRSATVVEFVGFGTPKPSFKFSIGMVHRDPE
jgi:hypothetical protein